MDLPILSYVPPVAPADLVRHYHKLAHDFATALAEPEPLDVGVAFANPALAGVPEANGVFSAALPHDMAASTAIAAANAFFARHGTVPLRWVMNPSASAEQTEPLIAELLAQGYVPRSTPILHLARRSPIATSEVAGLMVIPARAAFAQAEALALESAAGDPRAAAAVVQHLDEPRFDALLALADGKAVARVGVLAVGDLGLVEQLYVAPAWRGRGVEALLLARALEFCSRSGFKHVLTANVDDAHRDLLTRNGFEPVGTFVEYVRAAMT